MANPKFHKPGALSIEYRLAREGPNSYLVWQPHKSYICLTAEDVVKQTKWGRGTETGLRLREWLSELCEKGQNSEEELTSASPPT